MLEKKNLVGCLSQLRRLFGLVDVGVALLGLLSPGEDGQLLLATLSGIGKGAVTAVEAEGGLGVSGHGSRMISIRINATKQNVTNT